MKSKAEKLIDECWPEVRRSIEAITAVNVAEALRVTEEQERRHRNGTGQVRGAVSIRRAARWFLMAWIARYVDSPRPPKSWTDAHQTRADAVAGYALAECLLKDKNWVAIDWCRKANALDYSDDIIGRKP